MSYHNNIQFTELTPTDKLHHEDLYTQLLLIDGTDRPSHSNTSFAQIYYDYAMAEVQKANKLFQKTFG